MRPRGRKVMATAALALAATTVAWPSATGAAGAAVPHDPDPVVLVEGTGSGDPLVPAVDLNLLADRLEADGYQAFVFPLPGRGLGDIGVTSTALVPFVDQVLAQTGASQVDIVGHSQGGLVARYYIERLGGAAKVDSFVGLATPHYGTRLANAAQLYGVLDCLGFPFCQQVVTGSQWLRDLNGTDDTFGDVRYTNFASKLDLVVVPYTNSFQRSPGAVDVTIQDRCPLRVVEHFTLPLDGTTYSGIQDALAGRPITLDCLAL